MQNEVEKVSAFGKVTGQQTERSKPIKKHSEPSEPVGEENPVRANQPCFNSNCDRGKSVMSSQVISCGNYWWRCPGLNGILVSCSV